MDCKSYFLLLLFTFSVINVTHASSDLSEGISARVISGDPVAVAYPWMVSLQSPHSSGGWSHFCGGVLIADDWIATAAHCVENTDMSTYRAVIGAVDISDSSQGEVKSIDWYSVHQNYNADTFFGDIAIIRLATPSTKDSVDLITKAEMAAINTQAENAAVNTEEQMLLMGWGLTKEEGSGSNTLLKTSLSFRSDTACEARYPSFNNEESNYWDALICAGENSLGDDGLVNDACQGDSGGPLLWDDGNSLKLIGLVSWGVGCGRIGNYGGYSEVAEYREWFIDRQTGLSLVGPNKIGFLGYGLTKSETYRLINNGSSSKTIVTAEINEEQDSTFEIQGDILNSTVSANSEVAITINAIGSYLGEHNAVAILDTDGVEFGIKLNSKVLYHLETDTLGVEWDFYSGTNEYTEHAEPWFEVDDAEKGQVLRSGVISDEERSVLLTYINGPASGDLYLKFDGRVDAETGFDYLLVTVNETERYAASNHNWSGNIIALPYEVNRVQFIYIKDEEESEGDDAAYLSNFRVCTNYSDALSDEASCSQLSSYNHVGASVDKLEDSIGVIGKGKNAEFLNGDDEKVLKRIGGGVIPVEGLFALLFILMLPRSRNR